MALIVVSRAGWGAVPPRSRSTVGWGTRTHFAVHYSAGSPRDTVRSIQAFHMRSVAAGGRGWSDIGYNFLVDVHGTIYEGRGWETIGAHAAGWNRVAIGVCFIGRDGDVTDAAKRAIRQLYAEACRRKGGELRTIGHRDVNPTTCPGDGLYRWVRAGMPVKGASSTPDPTPDEGEDDMQKTALVAIDGRATWWVKEPEVPLRALIDPWQKAAFERLGAVTLPAAPSASIIVHTFGPLSGRTFDASVDAVNSAA